jgi:AraC family transcriptional regulator
MHTTSLALHGREVARQDLGSFLLSITRYDGDSSILAHDHRDSYATVVLRGGYEERAGATSMECVAGSIVVHPAGDRHANRFVRATTCLNIHGGHFDRRSVIPAAIAIGIASKLRREFLQPDDVSAQIVEALMMEIDALTRRGSSRDDRAPSWLRDVRRSVESRFAEAVTVRTLAAEAGVHPTHLARTFRAHFAVTIGEMVRECRIRHAKRELAAGGSPAEIAAATGFADQSHFTRVFRSVTGTTPGAYRRNANRVPIS